MSYGCVYFTEKSGTVTVVSANVYTSYNLNLVAHSTPAFGYDYNPTSYAGQNQLVASDDFENRFDRVWSSDIQFRGMRLTEALPVAGAITITITGSCAGIYTFGQLGYSERLTTKSFTIPTITMFQFPAITLYVRPGNALMPVPLSCFLITSSGYTMYPASEAMSLSPNVAPSAMNYHITNALPNATASPATSYSYTVTREISVMPSLASQVGGTFALSTADSCLCPSAQYGFETPGAAPYTTSLTCSFSSASSTKL